MACWYRAVAVATAVLVLQADFGLLSVRADSVGPSEPSEGSPDVTGGPDDTGVSARGSQPAWKCGKPGACFYSDFFPPSFCDPQPSVCAAPSCRAVRGMYTAGTVINADVNSFSYGGGPNHPPAVTVAAECCDACKQDKRCNVWNFCSAGNCGYKDSCTAFYKKYPAGPDKTDLRGVFSSGCADEGRFGKGACILRQATKKELASMKRKGPNSFTSGRLA